MKIDRAKRRIKFKVAKEIRGIKAANDGVVGKKTIKEYLWCLL